MILSLEVIERLRNAARFLLPYYSGNFGWYAGVSDENEFGLWNHWSASKDVLQEKIKRKLTQEEITIFSLSLQYGPTPVLPSSINWLRVAWWGEWNNTGGAWHPFHVINNVERFMLGEDIPPPPHDRRRRV